MNKSTSAGKGAVRASRQHVAPLLFSVLWLVVCAVIITQRQQLFDWWKLQGYTPSAEVSSIAAIDGMTPYAQRLFYVNRPELLADRASFAKACPVNIEKSIVLGCYLSNDEGIYLYRVTDTRLRGVVETTAAHEMLHAAYERLSKSERSRIDAMLQDFHDDGLKDERVRKTIEAYRASAPENLANEMHSIFATEVASLPGQLERYYSRYFTDRQKVIAEMSRYQAEFTAREQQVADYDARLDSLKESIDANQSLLEARLSALDDLEADLKRYQSSNNAAAYNVIVRDYNAIVDSYNALLNTTKAQVDEYNRIVEARNAIATEEQTLVRALSGADLPAQK